MEDVFRFRYQIYCNEKQFLSRIDYPHGMEFDEYDDQAVHFIVYGDDQAPLGYMRTIDDSRGGRFPLFDHGLTVHPDFIVPPTGRAVETSRMMVRSDYRHAFRSATDGFSTRHTLKDPPARNASDLIQLKLLRLAYRHALESDVRWFFAAIERPMARKLNMMGFPFKAIGPVGDYFGAVLPYALDLRELESRLQSGFPKVWSFYDDPETDEHSKVVRPGEWKMPTILKAA